MHPNIIIFLVDDMGTGDTSAYQDWTGNRDDEQLHTPSLERLARLGVRFTDAHTPSTVCTPTRYALLTGRYCWRTQLKHKVAFGPHYPPLIEKERPTLATILKNAGYRTGISGKWHVGLTYTKTDGSPAEGWDDADVRQPLTDSPEEHGFDYHFITNRSHGTSGNAGWIENRRCIGATGKNPHDIAGYDLYKTGPMNFQHAVGFLDDHLAEEDTKQQPFFLYYAANANHTPHTPCDSLNGVPIAGQAHFKNGKRELSRPHATTNDPNGWESTEWGKQRDQVGGCEHNTPERLDFIYENDVAVGQLLNYLETHDDPRNPGHKLIDNTLFIFSSDNGAENAGKESSGYYRGRKAHIHEGGHRVPTIAFWKQGNIGDGNDATPGRTSHITYGLNDLILSIADLVGIEASPRAGFAEDSTGIAPFLTGLKDDEFEPHPLVLHDDYIMGPMLSLRDGDWKLIVGQELILEGELKHHALFNLKDNPTEDERQNLIASEQHRHRVESLSEKLMDIYHQRNTHANALPR